MQGILYEEPSFWLFVLVTCIMGGWAAWMTGRAVARTWGSVAQCIAYLMVLGLGVRFIHFALFNGLLLSIHYYIVDTIVISVIGLAGYRYTRTRQMTTQYRWLYERTSAFSWRERRQDSGNHSSA
ncbi:MULTISPECIES: DUF6867 family protein [unclassified Chelatococcus]|uniref:DUF6867 family protein n=1 Tax=unclassified Chelatococcus TaxID=2638111 RepID=UPI001BD08ED2|nr:MULTISPECIES: hypothetical protein [unclassified Chelatococcus]MBS7698067.1 hypothetical protein [Chelatococcus sp. YT9]MBX3556615.1 hypothetical protein [Chelatococcus sp.]